MGAQFDAVLLGLRPDEHREVLHDLVQVGGNQPQLTDAGELQKRIENVLEATALALNADELVQHPPVAGRFSVFQLLGQQVEIEQDRREGVANLVGEAAGQRGDFRVPLLQTVAFVFIELGRQRSVLRISMLHATHMA